MPIPLSKLEILQAQTVTKTNSIAHVVRRKRASKALWVCMKNGKPITDVCNSGEEAMAAVPPGTDQFNIQKLHPIDDLELINKIKSTYT